MSGYKFTANLIQLSESKIECEAIKEWEIVETIRHDKYTEETRCICSRPLKCSFICRNKFNLKVVKMGSECVKKILGQTTKNIGGNVKNNNINFFTKGQYIDIHDLSQYVMDVLKEHIQKICSLEEIERLIELYKDHPQLQSIIHLVYEVIIKQKEQEKEERLRKEKEDEEKMKRFVEKQKQEKLLREKQDEEKKRILEEQIRIQNEYKEQLIQMEQERERREIECIRQRKEYEERLIKMEKERLIKIEEERKERKRREIEFIKKRKDYDSELRRNLPFEGCCSLRTNEHCMCKEPRFKMSHIDPYLDCSLCWKWKCRA
jgi:hypothetical protein